MKQSFLSEEFRDELVAELKPYAHRISIFGSFARDEGGLASDIDVLVDLKPPESRPPLGLRWFQLERRLQDFAGRKVELVTERALSPFLQEHIEKDRLIIYEE